MVVLGIEIEVCAWTTIRDAAGLLIPSSHLCDWSGACSDTWVRWTLCYADESRCPCFRQNQSSPGRNYKIDV